MRDNAIKAPFHKHTIATRDLNLLADVLDEFGEQWREFARFSVVRAVSNLQRIYLERAREYREPPQHIGFVDVYGALRRLTLHGIVHVDGARWVLGARGAVAA